MQQPAPVPAQRFQLHDYQQIAKQFLIDHPKAGLFLDVGFGKTLVTLSALEDLAMMGLLHGNILVIAPKAIARSTWIDEMRKWDFRANWTSLIVNARGKQLTRKKRIELYEQIPSQPTSFYFINKELVTDIIVWYLDRRIPWPFPTVVVDELQGFKSYSSVRFKSMKQVFPQIDRFIGLTGTPTPKGLMDLWSEIYLMDGGQRLGRTITEYRTRYFNPGIIVNGYPVSWRPKRDFETGWSAEDEIYSKIKDIVISIKNPDLKLPDLNFNNFVVHMSDEEMEVYKNFVKDKVLTVLNDDGSEGKVTAKNAGVLSSRLSQLASGTIYTGNGKEYAVLHQHKLEALEYIINNTTTPVLVGYFFQSDKMEIDKYLSEAGIQCETLDGSPEMIARWNKGDIPVMLLHPASVGHGINIQYGGHTLVWYTMPWSLEHYIQTIGRLHRQGQTDPVMVHHLMTEKTIDFRILKSVTAKDISERALMDAVSATLLDADE